MTALPAPAAGRAYRPVMATHGLALRAKVPTALVIAACFVAACGNRSPAGSSGAPPTVVCGQTISHSAAGAGVTDATRSGTITVNDETVGGVVLQVSKSCSTGATVHISPGNAMRVGAEAHAEDGGLAAMVLVPRSKIADVQISRPDGTSTIVHIRLS
jgi:hypothetical protein